MKIKNYKGITNYPTQRQQGMTLIEILIALLIGAFLIGGVMEIFINSRETYRMQDALSRLQENGRFAMDFIGRDIRIADYRNCPLVNESIEDAGGNKIGITGADGAANGGAQDSPDSLSLAWREENPCTNLAGSARAAAYTVVQNAAGIRELRRNDGTGAVPLIEGVENLQILYGVDTDNDMDADYYGTATQVTASNMGDVVSARVNLLLYTTDANVLDAPTSVLFNGEQTAQDRRLRRVFTSTISLRNRLK